MNIKKIYIALHKRMLKNFLILLIVLIIANCLYYQMNAVRRTEIGMYEDTKFDYILNACSYQQTQELKKEKFVENILPWSIYTETEMLSKGKKNDCVSLMVLYTKKIDDKEYSFFNKERCIKSLALCDRNDIFITNHLAKEIDVTIGEKIVFELEGVKKEKRIAGIFEDTSFSDKDTAIIFCEKRELEKNVQPPWISGAFLTTNDKEEWKKCLRKKHYYPEQYILDIAEDKQGDDRRAFIETLKNQKWNNMIVDSEKNVQNYNDSSLFSDRYINGVMVILFVLVLFLVFRFLGILSNQTKQMFQVVLFLGYSRKKLMKHIFIFYMLAMFSVFIVSIFLGCVGICRLVLDMYIPFSQIAHFFTIQYGVTLCMLCMFIYKLFKENEKWDV